MALIYAGRHSRPTSRPRSACPSGKLGWFSESDARLALVFAKRDHARDVRNGGRRPQSVYECTEDGCGSWHLTGRLQGERGDV